MHHDPLASLIASSDDETVSPMTGRHVFSRVVTPRQDRMPLPTDR
jgi:hypothetical protein